MRTGVSANGKVAAFDLSGGHPALDLVNCLDNRFSSQGATELLNGYEDLLRFMAQSRLLDASQLQLLGRGAKSPAATRTLRGVKELRETLASVLYGMLDGRTPSGAEIRTLQHHFQEAGRHRELTWRKDASADAAGAQWQWGRFAKDSELPLWILAQSAAELMFSDALQRIRACDADTCRWLFLDTSRNGSRRWCNMKVCGNRMKARRFQQRHNA
jgi:predicted RNA-binding Zn ribbon-like protein